MLPGVAFSNSSMTSFSLNSGAKRFLPAAIVKGEAIFAGRHCENFLAPF